MRDLDAHRRHKEQCQLETHTLTMCILCKKYLSSNEWSIIIETSIKNKFKLGRAVDEMSGDCVSEKRNNIEIKVSLGDKNGQFNFVQLRPDHNIKYSSTICLTGNAVKLIGYFAHHKSFILLSRSTRTVPLNNSGKLPPKICMVTATNTPCVLIQLNCLSYGRYSSQIFQRPEKRLGRRFNIPPLKIDFLLLAKANNNYE
jgi:hypothetical protein